MNATPFTRALSIVLTALHATPLPCLADISYFSQINAETACVVTSGEDLLHTTQITSLTPSDLTAQTNGVIKSLTRLLSERGSAWENIVKLNVYATSDEDAQSVTSILKTHFPEDKLPAIACVATALSHTSAKVAIDAVAVTNKSQTISPDAFASVLKMGPRVYVSGQAEKGDGTVSDATQKTMDSLGRTLSFLGLNSTNVIQLKCFITPISAVPDAKREIEKWFSSHPPETAPSNPVQMAPVSFVEWQSALPIEIEMIASAPSLTSGPLIETRTPPGMTSPAVYSRLTIARHPASIYLSGMYPATATAPPSTQLRSLFSRLKQCLDLTGSDWMHLAKATYYVSNNDLSKEHNTVRPDYFSPRRPPAASKANVRGVGKPGHGISMDFIVVPGEP